MKTMVVILSTLLAFFVFYRGAKSWVMFAFAGVLIYLGVFGNFGLLGVLAMLGMLFYVWRMALREPGIGNEQDPREHSIIEPFQERVWRERSWWMGGALLAHLLFGVAQLWVMVQGLSNQPVDGNGWSAKIGWGLAAIALGPAALVFYEQCALARDRLRHPRLFEGVERATLKIAHTRGGRLNAGELTMDTSLNLEQSAQVLRHFEEKQLARSEVAGDGSLNYVFYDFQESARVFDSCE